MKTLVKTPYGVLPHSEAHKKFKEADVKPDKETFQPLQIETDIWEPNPEKPGTLRYVKQMTVGQVLAKLKEYLPFYLPNWEESVDYFHVSSGRVEKEDEDFPKESRIACFTVTGSSEGHYIHVETIDSNGVRRLVFLGKTFYGAEFGWKLCEAIALILQA